MELKLAINLQIGYYLQTLPLDFWMTSLPNFFRQIWLRDRWPYDTEMSQGILYTWPYW